MSMRWWMSNKQTQTDCPKYTNIQTQSKIRTLKCASRWTKNGKSTACKIFFSLSVCSTCFKRTTCEKARQTKRKKGVKRGRQSYWSDWCGKKRKKVNLAALVPFVYREFSWQSAARFQGHFSSERAWHGQKSQCRAFWCARNRRGRLCWCSECSISVQSLPWLSQETFELQKKRKSYQD